MRFVRAWSDPQRWEWFAAGDPNVTPKILRSSQTKNAPSALLFETGLVLLVPLALAALIQLIFGV